MKAAFYTLGCKVNQYESEYMAELLKNAGFDETISNPADRMSTRLNSSHNAQSRIAASA